MAFKTVYRIGAKGQADVLIRKRTNGAADYYSMKVLGLHLLDQDKIFLPQPKAREVAKYIELDGEEIGEFSIDSNTISREPFDYTLTFAIFDKSEYKDADSDFISTNSKLTKILSLIEQEAVLFLINTYTGFFCHCYYKGIKVNEEKRTQYNIKDYLEVALTFRIFKSNLCTFDLKDFKCSVDKITSKSIEQSVYPLYNIDKNNDYDSDGNPSVTNTL